MPRSSAMCGALTRLTGSSVWPERIPTRAAIPSDARVLVGESAAELDLDAGRASLAERLGEAAELLAQSGTNGASCLHHLRADRRRC